jgi:hypothetical protein
MNASAGGLSVSFSLSNLSGGGATNLAQGKTATQSSMLPGFAYGAAGSAIDG